MLPILFYASLLHREGPLIPAIVPWPAKAELAIGRSTLPVDARIIATDKALVPLAKVLSGELHHAFGTDLPIRSGRATRYDLVLSLDRSLQEERFTVETLKGWRVTGGNYQSVAMGTSELLQGIEPSKNRLSCRRFRIEDSPQFAYRGLMIDVARKPHSIESLRQFVVLCRLYRIRYLQLHLTDDQGWTFPSRSFPNLGTRNEPYEGAPATSLYPLGSLRSLVRFADERGVTIVPEIDTPGHTGAMRRALGPPFLDPNMVATDGQSVLNVLDPVVGNAIDTLIGEVADVFRSSPYIHLGGDEAEIDLWKRSARFPSGKSPWDLYLQYMTERAKTVRRHGKQPLAWTFYRNHPGNGIRFPTDIPIMAWEDDPDGIPSMIGNGYSIIQNPWRIGYKTDPKTHYTTSPYDVHGTVLKPSAPLLGLQINVWESTPDKEFPILRETLPARMETVWHWPLQRRYEDFRDRWRRTDALLERLLRALNR